jgi:hypothetical protein
MLDPLRASALENLHHFGIRGIVLLAGIHHSRLLHSHREDHME